MLAPRLMSLLLCVTVLFVLTHSISFAQSSDSLAPVVRPSFINLNDGVAFEIAPHTGLMGKSGTFGISLAMNYSSFNLELAAEQVIGKTANLYPLSVNGILNLSTRSRLIPYGAAGVGLLLTVPTTTIGDETVSSIGFNFGAGARFYFTRTFGIRAEVKQYLTTVKSSRDARDELLIFQEIKLGVTFMVH
jgi:hypothetical protein